MKTQNLIDNICVYADPNKTHTVAIVVPVKENLQKFAVALNKDFSNMRFEDLCNDKTVLEVIDNCLLLDI